MLKIYGIQLLLPHTKIKDARNCHPYRQQAVYACTCTVTSSFFGSHLPSLICIGQLSFLLLMLTSLALIRWVIVRLTALVLILRYNSSVTLDGSLIPLKLQQGDGQHHCSIFRRTHAYKRYFLTPERCSQHSLHSDFM